MIPDLGRHESFYHEFSGACHFEIMNPHILISGLTVTWPFPMVRTAAETRKPRKKYKYFLAVTAADVPRSYYSITLENSFLQGKPSLQAILLINVITATPRRKQHPPDHHTNMTQSNT